MRRPLHDLVSLGVNVPSFIPSVKKPVPLSRWCTVRSLMSVSQSKSYISCYHYYFPFHIQLIYVLNVRLLINTSKMIHHVFVSTDRVKLAKFYHWMNILPGDGSMFYH